MSVPFDPGAWNPRYLAYSKAHGTPDPDEMLEKDREAHPGGCMAGFIVWIDGRWTAWRKIKGYTWKTVMGPDGYAEFDRWLNGEGLIGPGILTKSKENA